MVVASAPSTESAERLSSDELKSTAEGGTRMTKGRFEILLSGGLALCVSVCLGLQNVQAAEPLRKVRAAIPSIVIDFAPLWIARNKGIFRDERIDAEITYIQGNVRVEGFQAVL